MSTMANEDLDGVSGSGDQPNYPIGSVDNALRLLQLFSRQAVVRIADASRELDVARSTAHRMVQMLQYRGLVCQDPETRAYKSGPELVRMAIAVVKQIDVRSVAAPVMNTVRQRLRETVHLSELRGSSIFFLNSIESERSVRVGARTGMMLPAHCTAAGKVLLAHLPRSELQLLYPGSKLPKLTKHTHTSMRQLLGDLERVRVDGFATNFGESELEVHAFAVPVTDSLGRVRAALAVAAPPFRLTEDQVPEVVMVLTASAEEIGASLPI